MSELANIQRWLTSILVKPGLLSDKIRLADQNYQLDSNAVICSTVRMPSHKKIGIYASGYILRLMECMSAEFPAVKHLLGDELFNTFIKAYLVRVPSRSPDLYDLGRDFPTFLKASQPKNSTDDSMFDLPVEMAVFERVIAEVSRMKGLEGQERNYEAENPMLYLFGTTAFCASPCLILLRSRFALIDFIKATHRGEDGQIPEKKENLLAISRKNYIIHMHALEPWQWHFLQSLQSNKDYRAAIAATTQTCNISQDTLMADLMLWMPVALNFGYVYVNQ